MCSTAEQFSQIYDQYIEKIYRYVYLKVNSQEIAQDISSKVFMKGWEAFNSQENIKNPGAFLYKIAGNLVVDYYRQKGRKNEISTDSVAELVDDGKAIYEKAVFNADLESVKTAMQQLKDDYQNVLIWHYLEDMPIGQIAEMTGKKEGAVRVMIHRGLKELKGLVKEI